MTDPVRVILVDDHTLFRMGLAELLEQRGSIKVVGVTGNADEARRFLREEQPDVLVMDLHMPPLDGLTLFRQLRQEGFTTPTLMLTVSNAEEDLSNVLRAGARGYLLKDMEPDDVVDAILRASRGETVVAPAMTMKLVKLLQNDQPASSSTSMLDSRASVSGKASAYPVLPGDNINARLIACLVDKAFMSKGTTPASYYGVIVSNVGTAAAASKTKLDFQNSLVDSLEARRQELSGVNLDEEAANVIQYQKAYQAAAKLVSVADTLLDTLLTMVGR